MFDPDWAYLIDKQYCKLQTLQHTTDILFVSSLSPTDVITWSRFSEQSELVARRRDRSVGLSALDI